MRLARVIHLMVELRTMVASIVAARKNWVITDGGWNLEAQREDCVQSRLMQVVWFCNAIWECLIALVRFGKACLRPLIWASVLFGMLVYTVAAAWLRHLHQFSLYCRDVQSVFDRFCGKHESDTIRSLWRRVRTTIVPLSTCMNLLLLINTFQAASSEKNWGVSTLFFLVLVNTNQRNLRIY